jgi:gluconate 2-dehydrogenase alpha chain
MVTELPKTDVVTVGAGWSGLAAAYWLTNAGQRCVVLGRGGWRYTVTGFGAPEEHDKVKYAAATSR